MAIRSELVVKRDGGVVTITLNRVEKLNALNKEILEDLREVVDLLEGDRSARVIILTGSGEKAFCVGADLKERQGMNEKDILLRLEYVRQLFLKIEKLPQPVVAAINGTALGGGLELALACDLRLVVDSATLGLPEVDLAIIPGSGGTQRLSRTIGMARALECILMAKKFTAAQAFQMGLVNQVVSAKELMPLANAWAAKMGEAGPIALKQAKFAVRQGIEKKLEEALSLEIEAYRACLYSKDRLEGLKAFAEKRKPAYRGE